MAFERYEARYAPEQNADYPYVVWDHEQGTFTGPCKTEHSAQIVARAMNALERTRQLQGTPTR